MDTDRQIDILKQEIRIINDKIICVEKGKCCPFELQKLKEKKIELEKELDDLYPDIIA